MDALEDERGDLLIEALKRMPKVQMQTLITVPEEGVLEANALRDALMTAWLWEPEPACSFCMWKPQLTPSWMWSSELA